MSLIVVWEVECMAWHGTFTISLRGTKRSTDNCLTVGLKSKPLRTSVLNYTRPISGFCMVKMAVFFWNQKELTQPRQTTYTVFEAHVHGTDPQPRTDTNTAKHITLVGSCRILCLSVDSSDMADWCACVFVSILNIGASKWWISCHGGVYWAVTVCCTLFGYKKVHRQLSYSRFEI